ncbi:3D domain-containing protein [Clostridium sp. DL1XJH146]
MEISTNNKLKKYFSTKLLTFCFFVLVLFASIVSILNMEKTIKIVIDGNELEVTTYRSEVQSILSSNDIVLGPKDKIEPSLKSTLAEGDMISIVKAKSVTIQVGDDVQTVMTAEDNVGSMLAVEGIEYDSDDKLSASLDDEIVDGQQITIVEVEKKVEVESQEIEYASEIKKDYNAYEGTKTVVQEGKLGEREIKTEVVLENGEEVSRAVISDEVVKEPTKEIVAVGTLGKLTLSRGGDITYKEQFTMRATAYSLSYADTGKTSDSPGWGITYSGMHVVRDPSGYSTVAVDPNVIPLGSKLYVEGYGYAIAADIGGAIKGNDIDLYFNTTNESNAYGVKYIKVYLLK